MPAAPPVSIFCPKFPNPSETFIQAQADGLLERGSRVEIVALAAGDPDVLGAALLKWRGKLTVRYAPVPKGFVWRILQSPAAFAARGLRPFNGFEFGDDALSLRLPIAAWKWERNAPEPRVWLAQYGRWGRFACALRDLGLIAGPVATVFHGRDMSVFLRRFPDAYDRLLKRGDVFLPISELWRDKLLALGAPPERTFVQRMGVDTARFTAITRTLKAGEPVKFISVGRMVEKKGFDDAIRAFGALRSKGVTNATLTFIGGGELKDYLQNFATSLNLGASVRFAGLLPHAEVARELSAANVFVLPSKTGRDGDMEGIPVALMEAMAQGLPVLATRHSGTPELVEHDVSGLLCDEGDWRGLSDNMAALAQAPERWAAMGAAGEAKVRAAFDLKTLNDQLMARLRALWSEAVTSPPPHANTPP